MLPRGDLGYYNHSSSHDYLMDFQRGPLRELDISHLSYTRCSPRVQQYFHWL